MALPCRLAAQHVVIEALSGNGVLTWTNSQAAGLYRVEWTASLGSEWQSSWTPLTDIPGTNTVTARPVPMFYRVVNYPAPLPLISNIPVAAAFALVTNRLAQPDFIVLDVRTPSEYSAGRIKTALNLNFNSAAFRQTAEKLDPGRSYLVYCASGGRSAQATEVLRALGFMEVYNMTSGYSSFAGQPGAGAYVE